MHFRPCIDIHDGKVKQIVGSSLDDEGASENFVSKREADFFAEFYANDGLSGGHIIILNKVGTPEYELSKAQAFKALDAFPNGMQVGGGMNPDNSMEFIERGASHVIVTSYVFSDGKINYENLEKMRNTVGADRLVLDLSCRKKDDEYYVVTDRWQKFTDEVVNEQLMDELSEYCAEFLVHAVDVEGKQQGVEEELVELLGKWGKKPVTYAGGISSYDDIELIYKLGQDKLDLTIGSALDLFGGDLVYENVIGQIRARDVAI